jgi:hypothetical protein
VLAVYTSPLATGSSTPAPSAPSDNPPGYDAWSKYCIATPTIHILYISCIFQEIDGVVLSRDIGISECRAFLLKP